MFYPFSYKNVSIITCILLAFLCVPALAEIPPEITLQDKKIDHINYFDRFPDGQTLLLRPRVKNTIYEDDIFTLKKNNSLYYALEDIIDVLDLAITFNSDAKIGQGWFLREDWKIFLDLHKGEVISREKTYKIAEGQVIEDDGILFASQKDIEEWFSFKLNADIPQQYLNIESAHPLPEIAKNARKKRLSRKKTDKNVTILPRITNEYEFFDINTADIRLGTQYQRREDNAGERRKDKRHSAVVSLQGQALKHDAYFLSSLDSEKKLSAIITRFSKSNEDPTLLGPLKARSYGFGDINTIPLPLVNDRRRELGARISNTPLINTQFQTIDINGDAIPGWDVELYRNNIFINSQIVSSTGEYRFPNVQLFGGDNQFEVFFYGNQGEIRVKEISLPVTSELLLAQDKTYEVSVSLKDTQTYNKNRRELFSLDNLNFSARYNKVIGSFLTYFGINTQKIGNKNKLYAATGFTKTFKGTLLDSNFAVNQEGAASAQITARRKYKKWDIATRAFIESDDFSSSRTTSTGLFQLNASAQRNFTPTARSRLNVLTSTGFTSSNDNTSQLNAQISTGLHVKNINLSNNINYNSFKNQIGNISHNLRDTLAVRLSKGKFFTRSGINFDILPEKNIDSLFSRISYYPNNKFSSDLNFNYDLDDKYNRTRLNVNYTNKYFRASPFIEYDSNDDIRAGLNVNFGIIDIPQNNNLQFTHKSMTGKGLISSFVYHDKNGNKKFDPDDEALPDVVVESFNTRRRAKTDESGYSLIPDLPINIATDIYVDETTLPDSFMISGFKGASILPNPGEITELEFPIHMAGEIDGTVSVASNKNTSTPAKKAVIDLHPMDHPNKEVIQSKAALDGFYVASYIPPGRYLMNLNQDSIDKYGAAAPAPEIINIGHDGDVLYGRDMILNPDQHNVPVRVSYIEKSKLPALSTQQEIVTIKPKTNGSSPLSTALGALAEKRAARDIYGGLQKISLGGANHYTLESNDIKNAHEKCQEFINSAIPCSLEVIIPTAHNHQ